MVKNDCVKLYFWTLSINKMLLKTHFWSPGGLTDQDFVFLSPEDGSKSNFQNVFNNTYMTNKVKKKIILVCKSCFKITIPPLHCYGIITLWWPAYWLSEDKRVLKESYTASWDINSVKRVSDWVATDLRTNGLAAGQNSPSPIHYCVSMHPDVRGYLNDRGRTDNRGTVTNNLWLSCQIQWAEEAGEEPNMAHLLQVINC